jgi:small subunit ribosomal protein S2
MSRTPAAVWIVDTNKEHLAVEEARKLHIPIIGILDSNCDPDLVDFPIPGNDDAIRAVGLLTRVVADAVAEGLIARSGAKTGTEGDAAVGAEEPLAEWERELLGGDADKAAVDKPATEAATAEPATAAQPAGDTSTQETTADKDVVETAVEATGGDAAETATPASEATGAASEAPQAEAAAAAVEAPATEAPATDAPATEAPATAAPATDAPAEKLVVSSGSEKEEYAGLTESAAASDEGEFGPDSAAPIEDGSAPEGFEIKGNKTSKKFHAPSSPWYDRTNAEVWFRTPEAAEAAGFVNAESKSDASA